MTAILEARALTKSVHGATLVSGVDIAIEPGDSVAIVGPNGAGKSTLLRLLSGDARPSSGTVQLRQCNLDAYTPRELAMHRAVLSQHVHVTFPFTVEEIAFMGAGDAGHAAARPLVEAALHEVGMSHLRQRQFPTLSGGEQQRVHFARALVQLARAEAANGPGLLLLDEPTSSLDLKHQIALVEIARRHAREGTAVVAILHDLNLAIRFADRIVFMRNGAIVATGHPDRIVTDAIIRDVFEGDTIVQRLTDRTPFLLPQLVQSRD